MRAAKRWGVRFRGAFMRSFRVVSLLVAAAVAGCSPFSSDHEGLDPSMLGSDKHFQSYYVPKTLLTATITSTGKENTITLGWERIADRDYLFKVNYQRSIVHDDDLMIETEGKGFLSKGTANSKDRAADIVESAVKILMTNIGGTPFTGKLRSLPTAGLDEKHVLTVQLDPFDPGDLDGNNRLLREHGYCIAMRDRLDAMLPGSCGPGGGKGDGLAPAAGHRLVSWPQSGQGFFYRRPIEHKIVVYKRTGGRWSPIWAGSHRFEQQAELLEIKVDRGAFIEQKASLTFSEGVLANYTMNKPSELLGFMQIPTVIVNAVVQIPLLQVSAMESANTLKERELAAREQELKLRERELQMYSVGVSADGTRVMYLPPDEAGARVAALARAATVGQGPRAGELERAGFFANCRDQLGVTEEECDAAWQRRIGQ